MMKILRHSALVFASLFLAGLGTTLGGQAWVAPIKDFYDRAGLVVLVDVKKVTQVEVSTGNDLTANVYVAEAEVLQTLKSDYNPTPEKRKIAIVGSTIPNSSAVWEPIESKRYLAFLNSEQGHYCYSEKYAMRPISPEGKVAWIEKNAKGDYEILDIDLADALKKIRSQQIGNGKPASGPDSK